jgi:hypothetical protein
MSLKPGTHEIKLRSGEQEGVFTIEVTGDTENVWCYVFEAGRPMRGACP